ncbi:helix-turn-helix transcriptional regulator [Devosia chinhatensis]|uniref:helix-turn-helix transcriptional regulator n=1 Tax=Devosia chinhatensis TaxID=429727 RepID=UPI0006976B03|nr:LuxR family transcriptional regulator [Devosia chinhatensis]
MSNAMTLSSQFSVIVPQLGAINAAQDQLSLELAVERATTALGMDMYLFAAEVPVDDGTPFLPLFGTIPPAVLSAFVQHGLYANNPVLTHIRSHQEGTIFPSERFQNHPNFPLLTKALASFGAVGAAYTPVISGTDGLAVFATYSRTAVPQESQLAAQRLIGTAISLRVIGFSASKTPGTNDLSETQQTILQWMERGKSNGDIATIMGISKRACDYHVGEILRKLDVCSRTQAVLAWRRA